VEKKYDTKLYNRLARSALEMKAFDRAAKIIQTMIDKDVIFTLETCNLAMLVYLKQEDLKAALKLFNVMIEQPKLTPNVTTYHALMIIATQQSTPEVVLDLYHLMTKGRLNADGVETPSALLKLISKVQSEDNRIVIGPINIQNPRPAWETPKSQSPVEKESTVTSTSSQVRKEEDVPKEEPQEPSTEQKEKLEDVVKDQSHKPVELQPQDTQKEQRWGLSSWIRSILHGKQ